jgi:hypothetical protein
MDASWTRRLFSPLWTVPPLVDFTVQAPLADCSRRIAEAARPSLNRLHLRNLFADGRRYYLNPSPQGFHMTSNSKIPWRRARTTQAAVLSAELIPTGDSSTRIRLHSRMKVFYFLDTFIVPGFMASILVFVPIHPLLIALFIAVLFGLSWVGHRLTAALQVADMIYFIRKALEEVTPGVSGALGAGTEDVVSPGDFRQAWERFYNEHQNERERDDDSDLEAD